MNQSKPDPKTNSLISNPQAPGDRTPFPEFKALSDGLGFHPFSDGMPYSAITSEKPRAPSAPPLPPSDFLASGRATATQRNAGPRPAPTSARSVPPLPPRSGLPHQARGQVLAPGSTVVLAEAATPQATFTSASSATIAPASITSRFSAFLFDALLNATFLVVGCYGALIALEIPLDPLFVSPSSWLILSIFVAASHWTLVLLQEVAFGTSLGKRFFHLTLAHYDDAHPMQPATPGQILWRGFLFIPSVLFFGFGMLWAPFDSKKRFWHDAMTDLQPLQAPEES